MKINKYKLNDQEFLIYGDEELPKDITEIEHLGETTLEENPDVAIYCLTDFMMAFLPFKRRPRTRDKILFEAGIKTWRQLSEAYYLVRTMQSNYSRREREFIVEKYSELVN